MPELKPIAKESVPRALAKAERYRLLNEPVEAESICRDVLAVDPTNQEALACLILALSDMFGGQEERLEEARRLTGQLSDEYARRYYAGVVEERSAKAQLASGVPAAWAHGALMAAMERFEQAQSMAPAGNDDAILRWNACVRLIERHRLEPAPQEGEPLVEELDDDVPYRS